MNVDELDEDNIYREFRKITKYTQQVCLLVGLFVVSLESVVRRVNSAIHRIVIFSNFLNMFSNW